MLKKQFKLIEFTNIDSEGVTALIAQSNGPKISVCCGNDKLLQS